MLAAEKNSNFEKGQHQALWVFFCIDSAYLQIWFKTIARSAVVLECLEQNLKKYVSFFLLTPSILLSSTTVQFFPDSFV